MNRKERRASAKNAKKDQDRLTAPEAVSLAVKLHKEGHLEEADGLYKIILDTNPDYPDALHYRGVLCHQMGRSDEAVKLIGRVVALVPDHADAHNNLGNVLSELDRRDEAYEAYEKAVEIDPNHADARCNLGIALKDKGELDKAVAAYQHVLAQDPGHADAHHNLGNALKRLGRLDEAVESYSRAIELRPGFATAHRNLAQSLTRAGRTDEAAEAYRRWLMVDPDNPTALHMLAACSGKSVPARASDDYVKETFDRFAGSFDEVLERLEYRAPDLVAAALAAEIPEPDYSLDLLDAGCGTGLCAPLLRGYAKRLVGVDLSPGMIEKAQETGSYDELETAELTEFLGRCSEDYDAIVSADTLVYFGDLERLFTAAAKALRPGGRLIFTTERAEEDKTGSGYRIHDHGRYSHTEGYLRQTLADAGLVLRQANVDVLRKERGQEVKGTVTLARKEAG